jgi:SAM-dependent methyltransferase
MQGNFDPARPVEYNLGVSRATSIWDWPDGWAWRAALGVGARLRESRWQHLRRFAGREDASMLDVGTTGGQAGASNFIEVRHARPDLLTAVGVESEPPICRQRGIRFVQADGCDLPFADGSFDIAASNAVIEHVGGRARQCAFTAELCRVGRSVWLATPNAACPIEPHTLVPMAHWLPLACRAWVYRRLGREYFAKEANLAPLDAGSLQRCFPRDVRPQVQIDVQWALGLPMILIATWPGSPGG